MSQDHAKDDFQRLQLQLEKKEDHENVLASNREGIITLNQPSPDCNLTVPDGKYVNLVEKSDADNKI